MYKILVFSDTHHKTDLCEKLLTRSTDVNMVLHAGDCVKDALEMSYVFSDIDFKIVRGNNDYMSDEKDEILFDVCDKKIFLTHGHEYAVKYGYSYIARRAKNLGADIAVFGHTHEAYMGKKDGVYLLNPGSAGFCAHPGYGVITIENNILNASLHEF